MESLSSLLSSLHRFASSTSLLLPSEMDVDNPNLTEFRRQYRADVGLPPDDDMTMDDGASEATSFTLRPSSASIWSTPTAEGRSEVSGPAFRADLPSADEDLEERFSDVTPKQPTFIIATDFGTTFSSVAFAKRESGRWGNIQSISNYPYDPMPWGKNSFEIPTESWYPDVAIIRESFDNLKHTVIEDDPILDIYSATDDLYEAPRTPESISMGNGAVDDLHDDHDHDEQMTDLNSDSISIDDDTYGMIWGYGIQERLKSPDMNHSQFERVSRSKLMLDSTQETEPVRNLLRPILKKLKQRGTIVNDEDVISDYLTLLFKHTKAQLIAYHDLCDTDSIEHVLCVPNVWSSASSRKMQKAMQTAIRDSRLGSMENLFIVAEPEAAAAYVLDRNNDVNVGRGIFFFFNCILNFLTSF
jgi:hypothetical protein